MGVGPAERGSRNASERETVSGVPPTCGQLLQRYRSLAGLTQEALAERAGYSADYIGKLERDQRELPVPALERFGDVLALAPDERAALRAARDKARDKNRDPGKNDRSLVGRDAEVAEIRRHLAGLGPPVLLFAAEPGLGKTRLLEEAAAHAARCGWRIARGGCQRRAQEPYAPLSGAVAHVLSQLPDRDRAESLRQSGRLDLLLPELPAPGTPLDEHMAQPEQRRRLLFSSVERFLRAAAGQAGTLLVLDDLHWAGPDALDVLTTLLITATKGIRLIGGYRDSEAPARVEEFTADLARASLVRVRQLEPLSDADAERLLIELAPRRPDVLPAVVRRAGGVPFFLVSYVEDLRAGGLDAGGHDAPAATVPWTVAKVIRQRVLAMPEATRELLGVAAVIGPAIPHRLLAQVTGRDDDDVLLAVEAALAARLLAEDGQAGYCFTHDLIRETIERDLSAARRRLLHRRVGETLEREPGAAPDVLALHFGRSDDDEKATAYLELAGEQAQQRVAYAAAADCYGQAAERLELAGRPDEAVWVREKQGLALHRAGRHGEAIAVLERALAGYQAAGDKEGEHRVTGHVASAHFRRGTSPGELGRLAVLADLAGLRELLGPQASHNEGEAAGSHGILTRWQGLLRLLYAQGSGAEMAAVGEKLAQAGRQAGDSRLEAVGTGVRGAGLIRMGRLREGTALLAAAMPEDAATGQDGRSADAAGMLSGAYLSMGLLDQGEAVSVRMLRAAEAAGDDGLIAMHTLLLGAVRYVRGDWPRGRDLVGEARRRFPANDPLAVRLVPVLARTLIWPGEWDQARTYLEDALDAARSLGVANAERAALTHLAELDVRQHRPRDAIARLRPYLNDDLTWDYMVTFHVVLAAAFQETADLHHAQDQAERAVAAATRTGAWLHAVDALHARGQVQAALGDHDGASATFEEGLRRARAIPFPYGEARLLHAHGLLDRRRDDRAAANDKLAAALAIYRTLGADTETVTLRAAISEMSL